MQDRWWSLRKASFRFAISERKLRAAILSGDLVGVPQDDGEDWLIRERDLRSLQQTPETPADEPAPVHRDFSRGTAVFVATLAVITVVAAGLINISGHSDCGGPVRATQAIIRTVSLQADEFHLNHGRHPERLVELVHKPDDIDLKDWPSDGYLLEIPVDGWGREFVYRTPGTSGRRFDLFSLGEDPKNPKGEIWSSSRR